MVISHDRWFLDRIATHIIDYRDEGQVNFYEGNYNEYMEWLKKTLVLKQLNHTASNTSAYRSNFGYKASVRYIALRSPLLVIRTKVAIIAAFVVCLA